MLSDLGVVVWLAVVAVVLVVVPFAVTKGEFPAPDPVGPASPPTGGRYPDPGGCGFRNPVKLPDPVPPIPPNPVKMGAPCVVVTRGALACRALVLEGGILFMVSESYERERGRRRRVRRG